jgi:alkaline phosphatase
LLSIVVWLATSLAAVDSRADVDNAWRASGRHAGARARAQRPGPDKKAQNRILIVGDGQGVSPITPARNIDGQRRGMLGEENQLAFETFPYVALAKTYSVNLQVSESAATMTAIMSGVKTKADVIGLDEHAVPTDYQSVEASRVTSFLEEAAARGLATGIVTTTRVTHATPAAAYAHAAHRDWEDDSMLPEDARAAGFPDIARQLVEFGKADGIDVVFGGGRSQFMPDTLADPEHPAVMGARKDGRDLIAEWSTRHPA